MGGSEMDPPAPSGGDQAVSHKFSISQFPPHTLPPSGQQTALSAPFGLMLSRRPPPGPSKNLGQMQVSGPRPPQNLGKMQVSSQEVHFAASEAHFPASETNFSANPASVPASLGHFLVSRAHFPTSRGHFAASRAILEPP